MFRFGIVFRFLFDDFSRFLANPFQFFPILEKLASFLSGGFYFRLSGKSFLLVFLSVSFVVLFPDMPIYVVGKKHPPLNVLRMEKRGLGDLGLWGGQNRNDVPAMMNGRQRLLFGL